MARRRLGQGMARALAPGVRSLALALVLAACGGGGGAQSHQQPVLPGEGGNDGVGDGPEVEAPTDDVGMEQDLRRIFERKQSSVARCYSKRMAEKPDLAKGEFEIKTTITAERAGATEVRGVTWRDTEIEGCVTKLISEWTFPDVKGPLPFTYRYVFDKF
jgi:hypothetical protein